MSGPVRAPGRDEAARLEPAVRALTGATAPYSVKIEIVEVDGDMYVLACGGMTYQ